MIEPYTFMGRRKSGGKRPYIILFAATATPTHVIAQAYIVLVPVRDRSVLVFTSLDKNTEAIARVPSIAAKRGELIQEPIAFLRVE